MAQKKDNVNHPSHYTWLKEKCGIEVIDITRHLDFDTGNAVKYLLRAGHKEEADMTPLEKTVEDFEKAAWYVGDKIKMLLKDMYDQSGSELSFEDWYKEWKNSRKG
jgi:hypothetical protein